MIFVILIIGIIVETMYMFQPLIVLWDSAMYIGIGKYLFSHGMIGVFEPFRPPLLPLILGIVWKLGIDPLIFGKFLGLVFSIAEVYLVYTIGKEFNKKTGILAAILLGFTPVFIAFSPLPLTDIPSVFFATLAVWFVYKEKYWLSGISAALGFYFRFPEALILVPLLIYIISTYPLKQLKTYIKSLNVCLGFFILILPYLVSSFIFFHNPLLPILLAQKVASAPISAHGLDIFFYTRNLFIQNPFFILGFIPLVFFSVNFKKMKENSLLFLITLSFLIIGAYFNFNTHTELRYSIAFIPFLALMSAWIIISTLEKIHRKYLFEITMSCIAIILLGICWIGFVKSSPLYATNSIFMSYSTYFKNAKNASVITTSPDMISYSDIKIIEIPETWEDAAQDYALSGPYTDYIAINTCSLACSNPSSCTQAQSDTTSYLAKNFKPVFQQETHTCKLIIFKHL